MARGLLIPTTLAAALDRARLMANHPGTPGYTTRLPKAPGGYYRLKYPNGGTDPTAPDNFTYWRKDAKGEPDTGSQAILRKQAVDTDPTTPIVFVTGDCVSLVAWAHGFNRYQPVRGAHYQSGSINCDFMVHDANGPAKCFERLDRPVPGCIGAYPSLADQDHDGERDGAGHTWIIETVPPEWDVTAKACWEAIGIIDCASRTPHKAVQRASGRVGYGTRVGEAGIRVPKGTIFCKPIMR